MVRLYTKHQLNQLIGTNNIIGVRFNDALRKAAPARFRRFGNCQKCGVNKAEHAHHKNLNWRDNKPKNIMQVCMRCHKEIHTRMPFAVPLYKVAKIPFWWSGNSTDKRKILYAIFVRNSTQKFKVR